jgi:DNA-binding CsgD family transcriptional regulator
MGGRAQRAVSEADAKAMLGFIAGLAALEGPDDFRAGVLPGIRDLVPSEIASYNEVDFDAGSIIAHAEPAELVTEDAPEVLVRLGHQNPLVSRYQRTRDGRPYKWSDFITRRELHRTDLYREAYAPMGVEYQMAFCLPAPPEMIIGVVVNRGRRDFSERDRSVLNLVRGPMIQALRTVERYTLLRQRLSAAERGLGKGGAGVVLIEESARGPVISFASEEAAAALQLESEEEPLPEPLRGWLQRATQRRTEAVAPVVLPRRDAPDLAVHLLRGRHPGERDALLLEPSREMLSSAALGASGLTRREGEIIRLLAVGRSNGQIAAELGISIRTVHTHLRNAYEKLGVSSRTQAVQAAWSISRPLISASASRPSAT